MACGCRERRVVSGAPAPNRTAQSARAAVVASAALYEVLNSRGTPTGHRYTTLVAATAHASRIGGTTRPATMP